MLPVTKSKSADPMSSKRILLVEGPDDEHVIKALFGRRKLNHLHEIKPYGGIELLLDGFPVKLKETDIHSLGLVVDADTDLAARWQAIRDRLIAAGYQNVPVEPDLTGTVLPPPTETILPRFGIWLMPDNRTSGILEDFLRFLVPASDALLPHADNALCNLPEVPRFPSVARSKALIHTWLAWQEEPGRPLGQSITARFLCDNVPEVDSFVAWLQRLFFA